VLDALASSVKIVSSSFSLLNEIGKEGGGLVAFKFYNMYEFPTDSLSIVHSNFSAYTDVTLIDCQRVKKIEIRGSIFDGSQTCNSDCAISNIVNFEEIRFHNNTLKRVKNKQSSPLRIIATFDNSKNLKVSRNIFDHCEGDLGGGLYVENGQKSLEGSITRNKFIWNTANKGGGHLQ
jgi:hypothetical protein